MNATLLALAAAVLTLLSYHYLTEQLDYASVRRRQLDAWAAVSALLCLVALTYGGMTLRRDARQAADEAALALAPLEIPRLRQPSLYLPPRRQEQSGPVLVLADLGASFATDALAPADRDAPFDPGPGDARPASVDRDDAQPVGALGTEIESQALAPESEASAPTLMEAVAALPTPTLQRVVTRAPVAITAAPPTLAPLPTAAAPIPLPPTELPAPTPHCGEPSKIHMSLRIDEARIDRRSEPGVVRYRARVRNEASFPVVASKMVVTAQDSRSGSDQFGSDRRPDLQISARHEVQIEGAVRLEKYPSPFGRSELCVSFVTDTCGRQAEFPTTRRCFAIEGF